MAIFQCDQIKEYPAPLVSFAEVIPEREHFTRSVVRPHHELFF